MCCFVVCGWVVYLFCCLWVFGRRLFLGIVVLWVKLFWWQWCGLVGVWFGYLFASGFRGGVVWVCCATAAGLGLLGFLVLVIWIFLLWVAYCGLGPVCGLLGVRGVLVLGLVVCELVVGCFGFAGCVRHLNCFCLLDCAGCSLF